MYEDSWTRRGQQWEGGRRSGHERATDSGDRPSVLACTRRVRRRVRVPCSVPGERGSVLSLSPSPSPSPSSFLIPPHPRPPPPTQGAQRQVRHAPSHRTDQTLALTPCSPRDMPSVNASSWGGWVGGEMRDWGPSGLERGMGAVLTRRRARDETRLSLLPFSPSVVWFCTHICFKPKPKPASAVSVPIPIPRPFVRCSLFAVLRQFSCTALSSPTLSYPLLSFPAQHFPSISAAWFSAPTQNILLQPTAHSRVSTDRAGQGRAEPHITSHRAPAEFAILGDQTILWLKLPRPFPRQAGRSRPSIHPSTHPSILFAPYPYPYRVA